jgi:hypothetical protein
VKLHDTPPEVHYPPKSALGLTRLHVESHAGSSLEPPEAADQNE